MAFAARCFLSVFFIVSITIFSWIVVIVLDFYSGRGKDLNAHHLSEEPPFPDGKMNNIFWFIQLSDIHISKFRDPSRQNDLKSFCMHDIDVIKPVAVLVTGDIVDAKDVYQIGSDQYIEEWQIYQNVLKESKVGEKTEWLEVKGNHDNFNVPSFDSEKNMFRKFSMNSEHKTRRDAKSYQFVFKTDFGQYSFNALDANLDPGPKRPFNFFGHFTEEYLSDIEKLVEQNKNHNLSVWFGHYPLSIISGPGRFSYERNILKYGDVYLCGHLHTLGNLFTEMYAVHRNGHLELELGDWKDNKKYRVLAVDHDLISFSDVTYGEWPVVVVTNPKDAHYGIRAHEPLTRIRKSSHVRFLVFSPHKITTVSVSIDDISLSSKVEHVNGPFYVCRWNPELYDQGLHKITIDAEDAHGNAIKSSHVFSIDGSRPALPFLAAVILITDGQSFGCVIYFVTLFIIVGVPYFLRRCSDSKLTMFRRALGRTASGLVMLSKTDQLFRPLFIYGVYTAIGPWLVAELIDGHVGFVFVHGLWLKGRWIPEPTCYAYGFFQNVLFQFPLTLYLASYLDQKNDTKLHITNGTSKQEHHRTAIVYQWGYCWTFIMNSVLFFTVLLQFYTSLSFWRAYGLMAFLLSPVKMWSLFLVYILVKQVRNCVNET